jgi:hypothetical protein
MNKDEHSSTANSVITANGRITNRDLIKYNHKFNSLIT